MAVGSGIGSQLGISAETTYGTFVAATKFLRARSYSIERVANRVQGEGIQSGVYGPLGAQYVEATNAATASVEMDVQSTKMGVLLNVLMGGTVTPTQQGSSAAYMQTHALADTYGKSLSMQLGAPYRSGTVIAHSLAGGKVASATFSCDATGLLTASLNVDGKSFSTSEALATASYAAASPFHGGQMSLKLGTYSSESAVTGIRSVSVSVERPHDTEAYTAGASGQKSEPVLNGLANITASITADWLSKANFQDLAHGTTSTSLVWEFLGSTISTSTYKDTFRITLPSVYFEPATQGVGGADALQNTWNAVWRYDGTNLPKIEYQNADTAL